ncbi:MAG: hypothetical protein ACTSVZ_07625 [Promethearchaeota archaeon]
MSATFSSSVPLSPTGDALPSSLPKRKHPKNNSFRWADAMDLPVDEILLRIRHAN